MSTRTDRPEVTSDTQDAGDGRRSSTIQPDPRAVRVGLGPASSHIDEPALVVDPASAARIVVDGDGRAVLTTPGDGTGAPSATRRMLVGPAQPLADGSGVVRREIVVDGWRIEVEVESARRAALRERAQRGHDTLGHGGPTEVHAIIPGRVVSVSVAPHDDVVAGQQLLVVEAMKMQNELRAPRDGVVSSVAVAAGQTIEIGDLLLVLE